MKIQYPGVADYIESDIENVKLLLDIQYPGMADSLIFKVTLLLAY